MRRLEEIPEVAPHKILTCSLMDFLALRLTMARVAAEKGAAEPFPIEPTLKTVERRHLSRTARVYDAARVVSLSANEVAELPQADWAAFTREVKACNGWERRRILHLAYERWHERHILSGLAGNRKYRGLNEVKGRPRSCSSVSTSEKNRCAEPSRRPTPRLRHLAPRVSLASRLIIRELTTRTEPLSAPSLSSLCIQFSKSHTRKTRNC